ncbi:MAG: hypothetical protein AAF430_08130 [Myxococcota bacterium]
MERVYYDHSRAEAEQPGFRSGEATSFVLDPNGEVVTCARVRLAPNSLHALHGHGVVEALNRLPLAVGPIEAGCDAVLEPRALSEASRILYEADRSTYGATWEFRVGAADAPPREYCIVIDNREYQRTLSRLQYLVVLAGREGRAVRLAL